jgi:hypothetical protein
MAELELRILEFDLGIMGRRFHGTKEEKEVQAKRRFRHLINFKRRRARKIDFYMTLVFFALATIGTTVVIIIAVYA